MIMQRPTTLQPISTERLTIIAARLGEATKYAYAGTWVDGGAQQYLTQLMLENLTIAADCAGFDLVPRTLECERG